MDAFIFDLYGTLLHVDERALHRGIPSALGIDRRRWLELLRNDLLTRSFDDVPALARFICTAFAREGDGRGEAACAETIGREFDSIRRYPGTLALLHFLKRRGFRLGLISNCSSVHKQAVGRLALEELFDAAAFSCDVGTTKPDPRIYGEVLAQLGADAGRTVFVGDSWWNDVVAPGKLGMETVGIGVAGSAAQIARIHELGLFDFDDIARGPLVSTGSRVDLGGRKWTIDAIGPVDDEHQGRYNLVYEAAISDGAERRRLFLKRFLLPETSFVEEFAYRMQKLAGLPTCDAAIVPTAEPLLAVTEACGVKYDGTLDEAMAYEIGRQLVFAYVFSNADMRPRNAFVSNDGEPRTMTMVDLEHCFFNLALDVAGIDNPLDPAEIDRLGRDELQQRVRKRVLTSKTTHRTRRTFFDVEDPRLFAAFHQGFVDFYTALRGRSDAIADALEQRVHEAPALIIGTHGYRRALATIDVEDIRERLGQEPQEAFDFCY